MIINIRGTNGSGKTWLARAVMAHPTKEVKLVNETVRCVLDSEDKLFVGKYDNACGGCDTIKKMDLIEAAVEEAVQKYKHVIFEGILITSSFSRWWNLSKRMNKKYGESVIVVFLKTPPDVCINRIYERNGGKDFRIEGVIDKWVMADTCRKKFEVTGEKTYVLEKQDEYVSTMKKILNGEI